MTVFDTKTTIPTEQKVVYLKTGAQSGFDGENWPNAVPNLNGAQTRAAVLNPTQEQPVTVISDSGVIETDPLDTVDNVRYRAPDVQIITEEANPTITMGTDVTVELERAQNDEPDEFALLFKDSIVSRAIIRVIQNDPLSGTAIKFEGTSSPINNNLLEVDNFILNASDIAIHNDLDPTVLEVVFINSKLITQNKAGGVAIKHTAATSITAVNVIGMFCTADAMQATTGSLLVEADQVNCFGDLISSTGGTTTFHCPVASGNINISGSAVIRVDCQVLDGSITIGAGCTAEIEIDEYDFDTYGEPVINGVLNGRIGGKRYGTWRVGDNNRVVVEKWEDFGSPSAGKITLDNTKYYEIFGTVDATTADSIDPDGAEIFGAVDRSNDKITSSLASHSLFSSAASGVIKDLYISVSGTSSKVFDINGATGFETWTVKDCSFNGNVNVGDIVNLLAWDETNCVYQNNSGGLTYTDIQKYAEKSSSWIQNNTATTNRTFTGTSDLLKITGGGMGVASGKTGMNFDSLTVNDFAQINGGYAFSGSGTPISDLTVLEDKAWSAEAVGIDQIYKDIESFSNISKDGSTTTTISVVNTPVKITGATTLNSSFRMTDGAVDNRVVNDTNSRLRYTITGNAGVDNASGGIDKVSLYVAIDGAVDTSSQSQGNVGNILDVQNIGIDHTFYLDPASYAEVWVENNDDTTDIVVARMNYTVRA